MSGGKTCSCDKKPLWDLHWAVINRNCNYSAFNGYRYTTSDYSCVVCTACGAVWRTKAAYVERLPDARMKDGGGGWERIE